MTPTTTSKARREQTEAIYGDAVKAPDALINDKRLKDKDVRVWLCIRSRLDADTCDLSAGRVGRAIGCKSTAVENSIKRLMAASWLDRSKRPKSCLYDYSICIPENLQE